jgi:ferric-dicitrate binding protein FerR (iron transport regulator)
MSEKSLEELLDELISGSVSSQEAARFVAMVDDPRQRQALELLLQQRFDNDDYEISPSPVRQQIIKAGLMEQIALDEPDQHSAAKREEPAHPPARLFPFRRWAAAAAILIILAGSTWLFLYKRTPAIASQAIRYKNDAAPGGNKATLELADGSTIQLDDSVNGKLTSQGAALVMKKDSTLTYVADHTPIAATGTNASGASTSGAHSGAATGTNPTTPFYNKVSTPTAGQYHLILSDGTQVWLDALSGIRFPSIFEGQRREVEITGQAYLEVARSSAHPFFVKVKDQLIQVLGTSFNVNAYDNEPSIRTTLAEGAVKVIAGEQTLILKPGQQAQLTQPEPATNPNPATTGKPKPASTAEPKPVTADGLKPASAGVLKLVASADLDAALAWKNGLFTFKGADIETMMRQVSRWYGVQIVYKDKVSEEFVADIPRNVPLSRLLALLEGTRQVYFTIEGKTVTISNHNYPVK